MNNKPEVAEKLVQLLSNPKHAKVAANLVKEYKLNHEKFPELLNIVSSNSARFFIVRAFKAPSHQDYMPIHKVEDLFLDYPKMLVLFIEELIKKGNKEQDQSDQEAYY